MPRQKKEFSIVKGNAKVGEETLIFSLPSGHSCPFALACLAKADPETGKIEDGPRQEFRCFSASAESAFPSVRKSRWKNWHAVNKFLKEGTLVENLLKEIPEETPTLRIHVAGDFFSQAYFDAWLAIARLRPKTLFYAYTKSLPFWKKRIMEIPTNFRLTASMGGTKDAVAKDLAMPTATVVYHPEEAQVKNLQIDHDDSHAKAAVRNHFALLLHGPQKAKTPASQALQKMRQEKIPFGYRKAA